MIYIKGNSGDENVVIEDLYGTDVRVINVNFDNDVEANGGGGTDTAKLYDAVLEAGRIHYADVDAILWLAQFEQIHQHDTQTEEDTPTAAVDEVFTVYWM